MAMRILDDALPLHLCVAIEDHWPTDGWIERRNAHEYKRGHRGPFHSLIDGAFRVLAGIWEPILTELAGEPLTPDFTFRGGGLHEIPPGGFLGVHTDFTEANGLYRRANTLLYLNRDWDEDMGGELLYRGGGIPPIYNRSVAFLSTPDSWHGHPDPWSGPDPRRSLALYWYAETPGPGHLAQGTVFRDPA